MMQAVFAELIRSIVSSIEAHPGSASARKTFTLELARLGQRLFSKDAPVAWCGVLAPFDLLSAMGVSSCFVEFVGGWLASVGMVEPMLQAADQHGYPTDCCSYHRAVIGANLKGVMPDPDFLVATSTPCSAGLATIENLAKHFKKDLFTLHIPYDDTDGGVRHLADQFRSLTEFVSEHTGRELEDEALRRTIERSNRASELLAETYELASAVPSPARARDLSNYGICMTLLLGTEAAIEVAEAFRDEFARKIEAGKSGVADERVRLLWVQNRIQFKSAVEPVLEAHGAAVVFDELNQVTWEPIDVDDPYTGMARRALSSPLTGPIDRRVRNLQERAKAYKIDGAIHPCHWGCRQGTGARGMIE
ncbi:MAG: 2-hydroxyacyl-CoA dehydratase, partial [Phycisphaerae bacterium]|nr:2-hydroxyacyl-CoA dehydratase [Phycisphaerae bacterium]